MVSDKAKAEEAKKQKALAAQYFEEARAWDSDKEEQRAKSERRAWKVAGAFAVIAVLEAGGIFGLLPLKTVVPYTLKFNETTGETVVGNIANAKDVKQEEAANKFWLKQYVNARENYQWSTRTADRRLVGLLSDASIQQQYMDYTDPKKNDNAPVTVYGENAEVEVKVKSISILNAGEKDDHGELQYAALVRYTKTVKRAGETTPPSHWAATITFVYRNPPTKFEDQLDNPVGFQVISYRNDAESGGF